MPYSKNPERVAQLYPWLTHLIAGEDCFWDLTGRKVSAETLAYRIREVLYISRIAQKPNGDLMYPELAAIADDVVVEVEDTRVIARFGKIMNVPLPEPVAQLAERKHVSSMYTAAKSVTYNLETIKLLWSKRQGDKVHLPMYTPDQQTLLDIYNWAQTQTPVVMIMPADDALNLVAFDPELEGIDWTPEDTQNAV